MKTLLMATSALCAASAFAFEPDWNVNVWEPWTPVLDAAKPAVGFDGRALPLERVTAADVAGDPAQKAWKATAWRNERVSGQFVVWSQQGERQIRLEASDLVSDAGRIPASAVEMRFVRYVRASLVKGAKVHVPEQFCGDCLDVPETADGGWLDMPKNGFRPFWATVHVPKDAAAGTYRGEVAVRAFGDRRVAFPIEITVRAETLADPGDWAFYLDLWQHPWAVARYHHVKPFSPEHLERMRPVLTELASGGQKTITASITDLPWNHQNFDAYRTMVEHIRMPDGSWKHDYTDFDTYVAFARSCGIGPAIHCYTMASWGNIVYYMDGKTGDKVPVELKAGTPEHEAFWGPFLRDFTTHLAQKGWIADTYISLDERSPEELRASVDCVKKYAPALKVSMAGNKLPSAFKGITVDTYVSGLGYITPEFLAEIPARRAKGYTTAYYICCGPERPNTFAVSPLSESRWLGLYAAAKDLDGMLRWAAFNWPRDPYLDTTFPGHRGRGSWKPADTYLLYPNGRASVRWEVFRDSIENFEKIRALRAANRDNAELKAALAALGYDEKAASRKPASAWAAEAERIEKAIDASSRVK